MILREEQFEQTNGSGVLELRGGDLELALFVDGEPFVYDAYDCAGSVGRFAVLLPDSPNLPEIQAVELNAQKGFEGDIPLSQQISPLLKLLPNGFYRLVLIQNIRYDLVEWDLYGIEIRGQPLLYYPLGKSYEHVKCFVPTQLSDVLDDERINFYLGEIAKKLHPALIVVGSKDHDAWFVLDGHHKLEAYLRYGPSLRALLIEFQSLVSISLIEARDILNQTLLEADQYLEGKVKQQKER